MMVDIVQAIEHVKETIGVNSGPYMRGDIRWDFISEYALLENPRIRIIMPERRMFNHVSWVELNTLRAWWNKPICISKIAETDKNNILLPDESIFKLEHYNSWSSQWNDANLGRTMTSNRVMTMLRNLRRHCPDESIILLGDEPALNSSIHFLMVALYTNLAPDLFPQPMRIIDPNKWTPI